MTRSEVNSHRREGRKERNVLNRSRKRPERSRHCRHLSHFCYGRWTKRNTAIVRDISVLRRKKPPGKARNTTRTERETQKIVILFRKFDDCSQFTEPEQVLPSIKLNKRRIRTEDPQREKRRSRTTRSSNSEVTLHPSSRLRNIATFKSLPEERRYSVELYSEACRKDEVICESALFRSEKPYLDHPIRRNIQSCMRNKQHPQWCSHVCTPALF